MTNSTVEVLETRRLLAAQVPIGINFGANRTDSDTNATPFALAPTDVAGVVPIANWNNENDSGTEPDNTTIPPTPAVPGTDPNLKDATGAASGVGVQWVSNGTWDAATQEDHTDQFTGGDRILMAGYLDNYGGSYTPATTASLTTGVLDDNGILLTGLTGPSYDVFLYSLTAVRNRPDGTITVTGAGTPQQQTITTPGTVSTHYIRGSNGNYLVFPGVKPQNGNILITPDGVTFRTAFSGLEIVPSPATAPAAPTIGTATYASGHITVTFTDNSDNEQGFDIQRSTDGTNFTTVSTLVAVNGTGGKETFVDPSVNPSTSYTYRVVATNTIGSAASGTASATTAAHFPGFLASFYSTTPAGTMPFSGDSVAGKEQLSADGKNDEGVASTGTAVLGYQELLSRNIDFSGNDSVPPPDAPASFNTIEGFNNQGHAFASRFSGYFTPTVTGWYTLGYATDDGGSITIADVDANGGLVNPRTLTPIGQTPPPPDNITVGRGNTEDLGQVDEQWIAGKKYYIQFDQSNGGGGWDFHAYDAISSSQANQTAQTPVYDVQPHAPLDFGLVTPAVPIFKTIDAANPAGLAKDNPYYTGSATGGPGEVELDFNSVGADSYNIYRATSAAGPFTTPIATLPGKAGLITYTDTNVTSGTQYFYVVTGINVAGETPQANGIHLSAAPAAVAPAAPVAVFAVVGAIGNVGNPLGFNVTVNWTHVPIASSYNVLRGTTAGGPYTQIASGITGLSYTDPTAQANTTYFYVVQAVNSAGTSPNSNELSAALGKVGLPNNPNAVTEHFYHNEWWGSGTQDTTGYKSPSLIALTVTSPFVDTNGSSTIDLHGDDTAGDPLPPNGDEADNFSTIFTGKLQVAQAGSYTFNANTDDDGYMVIDGQIVATNPGGHGPQEGNATPITLTAGAHDFAFYQSNGGGGWDWHMEWNGPDTGGTQEIVPVGASATHGGIVSSTESTPKDPTAGSVSINGTTATIGWTDNSTSELEYVLQRSTDANFAAGKTTTIVLPFVENKGGAVATGSYTDSGLANGTYFYRLQAVNYDGQSAVLSLGSGTVGGGNFNKADFNHSGKVDFADLLILAQNYGKAADSTHGDTNGDGKVDFSDLLFLAQNYGKTGPQAGKTRGSLLSDVVGLVKTH